jgi:hypothetical protein
MWSGLKLQTWTETRMAPILTERDQHPNKVGNMYPSGAMKFQRCCSHHITGRIPAGSFIDNHGTKELWTCFTLIERNYNWNSGIQGNCCDPAMALVAIGVTVCSSNDSGSHRQTEPWTHASARRTPIKQLANTETEQSTAVQLIQKLFPHTHTGAMVC